MYDADKPYYLKMLKDSGTYKKDEEYCVLGVDASNLINTGKAKVITKEEFGDTGFNAVEELGNSVYQCSVCNKDLELDEEVDGICIDCELTRKEQMFYEEDTDYYFRIDKDCEVEGVEYKGGWSYIVNSKQAWLLNMSKYANEIDKEAYGNAPKEPEEEDEDSPQTSTSPKELLKDGLRGQVLEVIQPNIINWIEEDKDWEKEIKPRLTLALSSGEVYNEDNIDLFFMGHFKDKIKGKLQLIEQHKERIPIIKRYVKETDIKEWDEKKGREVKTGKTEQIQKYLMIGEKLDGRSAGICTETYSEDMNIYQLVSEDNKKYIVFCKEDLPNCSCELEGMIMEMEDNADITKNLKLPSITRGFLMKSFDPSVKILTREQIIDFTKTRGINLERWDNFLGYHELGSINRFSEEFTRLRSSWILSGKKDGSPMHIIVYGIPGSKKSGLLEGISYKFSDNNIILEGGNSTIKMLKPAFKEKPATLGHYANAERVALVDEVGKMAENELNKHQSSIQNIFGDCNFLFDHKKRIVGSGNNNDCSVEATFKGLEATNPISNMPTIAHHVGTIDGTNMSRKINWVQDEEETEFLFSEEAILRLPPTHNTIYKQFLEGDIKNIKNNIDIVDCVGGIFSSRDEFLTLFDTSNSFECELDNDKIQSIYNSILQLAREPMKTTVWQPRGLRHTFLLIDGLVKERCLFKDYDMAERILVRMVKGWDTDMSPKEDLK